ncbi:hypothetical protein [Evansella clarkii]|uniref:hypothetical protein n=2 Tax=Evansella clarkii TaxID=79879 RepID=UPI000B453CB5|nr:hypothetical protein [Evansella clarkii]
MKDCPVCNGMKILTEKCPSCSGVMSDKGRYMDYFDDYSPYMPIEQMKEIDGIKNDKKDFKCPHLLTCEDCGEDKIFLVQEEEE